MSDRVFYVGSEKDKQLTGYVPAKFLTINGRPAVVHSTATLDADRHRSSVRGVGMRAAGCMPHPNKV